MPKFLLPLILMTVSLTYRFTAIVLAFMMFFSSFGYSIDMHYCQGQLQDTAFFGEAKSCHEMAVKSISKHCQKHKKSCHTPSGDEVKECKKGCCDDKTIVVDGLDEEYTTTSLAEISEMQIVFLTAFVKAYFMSGVPITAYTTYRQYRPPLPKMDRLVLYQTFLI